jgi:hypothetical protein
MGENSPNLVTLLADTPLQNGSTKKALMTERPPFSAFTSPR